MGSERRRRFSTVLMATIIVLVAMSVVIILSVLSEHFSRRVESEFQKKLRAQQGQAEILINNRFADIRNVLDNLAADNTVRVTVMLGARSQLKQRISQTYPSGGGAYYFVQKYGDVSIFPLSYPGLSQEFIASVFEKRPYEEIIKDGSKTRLMWLFITPIMNTEGRMGTAYALYDLVEDKELIDKYAAEDALYTYKLWDKFSRDLKATGLVELYNQVEQPLFKIVADMQIHGINIDTKVVQSIKEQCEQRIQGAEQQIHSIMGKVNLNSPKQMREWFIDKRKLQPLQLSPKTNAPSIL